MITQQRLHELFDYRNGHLYWKVARTRGVQAGDQAGSINGCGYIAIGISGQKHLAHRLIFLWHHGFCPQYIDHIDRNRSNNQISNLRSATSSQNQANVVSNSRSTSGVMGVSWDKRKKKWRSQIRVHGKALYLGLFPNIDDAKIAYTTAKQTYFGEFSPIKGGEF